jgi:nitrite reductase (NADH) small subunit
MPFTTLCTLNDIPALGARRYVRDDGLTIAVFRGERDKLFALNDKCPHKGGPLSQGIVFGESVACPLHNWCISLKDGTAAAPDIGVTEHFQVRVVDGKVELDPYSAELAPIATTADAATASP